MTEYFTARADKEFKDWQKNNKNTFKKINDLIDSILDHGMLDGIGKPEQLKHYDEPTYSRTISKGDRLVYTPYNENDVLIISCKGHYDDK
jgi:toxin YoeB